jgi:hypothetical protein
MKVAINQSNYIPWKGYFDLIHDVDVFLFYDDVQFTTRDWRNRNRIKTPQGVQWLTVPVGADRNRRICEVEIRDHGWQRKHWETLRRCYARAPHFKTYAPFFAGVYLERVWTNLSALNQYLIVEIAQQFLGITTAFRQASDFDVTAKSQNRILALLEAVGADTYHSGPAGKAYLDPARFAQAGIELVWKDYGAYPEYPQVWPPFEHAVTIADLLFSTGPQAADFIWNGRSR